MCAITLFSSDHFRDNGPKLVHQKWFLSANTKHGLKDSFDFMARHPPTVNHPNSVSVHIAMPGCTREHLPRVPLIQQKWSKAVCQHNHLSHIMSYL